MDLELLVLNILPRRLSLWLGSYGLKSVQYKVNPHLAITTKGTLSPSSTSIRPRETSALTPWSCAASVCRGGKEPWDCAAQSPLPSAQDPRVLYPSDPELLLVTLKGFSQGPGSWGGLSLWVQWGAREKLLVGDCGWSWLRRQGVHVPGCEISCGLRPSWRWEQMSQGWAELPVPLCPCAAPQRAWECQIWTWTFRLPWMYTCQERG